MFKALFIFLLFILMTTLPVRSANSALAVDFSGGAVVNSSGSATTWTDVITSKTGGCASGDVVLVELAMGPSNACPTASFTITPPSGFTATTMNTGTNPAWNLQGDGEVDEVFQKVAGGSEPNTYSFTVTGLPTSCTGTIFFAAAYGIACVSGENTSTPVEKATQNTTPCSFNTTCTAATATATTSNADLLVAGFFFNNIFDPWTISTPATYASAWNYTDNSTYGFTSGGSYLQQGSAGATGTPGVTMTSITGDTLTTTGYMLAIAPSAGGAASFKGFWNAN